jgi:hypothetical protein
MQNNLDSRDNVRIESDNSSLQQTQLAIDTDVKIVREKRNTNSNTR